MKNITALLAGVALAALLSAPSFAQSYPPPQVQSIGPTDLFQDVPGGNPAAGNYYASAALLGNLGATEVGNNPENALIGGDATTNLFQRGTTGASVTTAVTYGGPDRWAYWSGTSTAMTVSQDTTAADLATGYADAFKMARTAAQTGVVQMCMLQEIATINSLRFAGQTAELDFHAATGANFSADSANMKAYIITGTGTDEGVAGTASVAYGLNAGGGGSGGWTGQVNWVATVNLGGVSQINRYSIAAPIPAGTTEIAVALCYKPVGTAGANDYVAFGGIQLVPNSALTSLVSGNASGTATALRTNDTRAKSFRRRPASEEQLLQYSYYWQLNDPAATVRLAPCQVVTANSVVRCLLPLPATMRAAPTITAPGSHTAFAITASDGSANVCTALAATGSATVLKTGPIQLDCTPTSNIAVTVPSQLIGDSTVYNIQASAEF